MSKYTCFITVSLVGVTQEHEGVGAAGFTSCLSLNSGSQAVLCEDGFWGACGQENAQPSSPETLIRHFSGAAQTFAS